MTPALTTTIPLPPTRADLDLHLFDLPETTAGLKQYFTKYDPHHLARWASSSLDDNILIPAGYSLPMGEQRDAWHSLCLPLLPLGPALWPALHPWLLPGMALLFQSPLEARSLFPTTLQAAP